MSTFLNIILFPWQLLQNLLGLVFLLWFKGKKIKSEWYRGAYILWIQDDKFSGISLGMFIIINSNRINDSYIRDHEYGHTVQSKLFGPLYLLLVGLPSQIRNTYNSTVNVKKFTKELGSSYLGILKARDWYYSQYPESWADLLGDVDRPKYYNP